DTDMLRHERDLGLHDTHGRERRKPNTKDVADERRVMSPCLVPRGGTRMARKGVVGLGLVIQCETDTDGAAYREQGFPGKKGPAESGLPIVKLADTKR